jgi:hypothetical protein
MMGSFTVLFDVEKISLSFQRGSPAGRGMGIFSDGLDVPPMKTRNPPIAIHAAITQRPAE